PFWLGRTKRDLPPLRLAEDHWLRSLGPKLYGFVQRLVPDAGLREARWLTFVVLGVAIVAPWQHMRHGAWVLGEAQRRFTAEQHHGSLPVTDPNVATATWRSTGWLSRDQLELRWSAEFSLAESPGVAEEPAAGLQLAFTFHPHLDAGDFVVEKVSASGEWEPADEWALTDSERHWDRWLMKLVPRPEVGERFRLSGSLKGRAADLVFILRGEDGASFSTLWDDYQNRRAPFRRSDLTKSRLAPAVTNRGVQLRAEMLGLVPRYSTWELTPKPVLVGERGWDVPEESSSAGAKVELDLTFLPELTLEDRLSSGEVAPPLSIASTCGGMSKVADLGEPVRLVDSCAMPVHELQILGGRWVRLGELPVLAAASSRHERKLRSMLPELQQTIAASSKAWPGYSGIDRLAVVEQAPELVLGGRGMMLRIWEWSRPESLGRLVRFGEHHMAADGLLDPAAILDGILGTEVAASRRLDPDQRYMLRSFLSSLMKRRMGVAKRNAILGQGKPAWYAVQLKRPLLGLHPYHGIALAHKVPAVVLQLERRVGIDTLVAAVADLLSRETEDAATAEELFELLEARSGEDLDGFFQDFFVNGSLPELSLEDVRVIPRHGGFRVVGAVANAADGQVDCPVVVRTDGPELRQDVIVPSRGRGEFSFDVDVRPQVAILDPQGLCLRLFGGGGMGAEQVPLR
ncbi:MAG: hypothetical protein MPN21_28375, partial [Thermoanaerobaculia bacterium]|nr:hypothetical protein [Thermoanaerobaculia bacterium]